MLTQPNFSMRSVIEAAVNFHAKVRHCKAFSSLNSLCLRYTTSMRINALAYHHLPQFGAADEVSLNVLSFGFPDAVVDQYEADDQSKVDPSIRQVMLGTRAHWWREMEYPFRLSREEKQYLETVSGKVGEGLILPVFGPHGRNGFISLSLGDHKPDWAEDAIPHIHSCCQLAHLQYCELLQVELPNSSRLSRREKEVLSWVAQGKSNGVIASILDIAESTIITHLERAYKKLGVDNRVTAALRASSLGELNYFL